MSSSFPSYPAPGYRSPYFPNYASAGAPRPMLVNTAIGAPYGNFNRPNIAWAPPGRPAFHPAPLAPQFQNPQAQPPIVPAFSQQAPASDGGNSLLKWGLGIGAATLGALVAHHFYKNNKDQAASTPATPNDPVSQTGEDAKTPEPVESNGDEKKVTNASTDETDKAKNSDDTKAKQAEPITTPDGDTDGKEPAKPKAAATTTSQGEVIEDTVKKDIKAAEKKVGSWISRRTGFGILAVAGGGLALAARQYGVPLMPVMAEDALKNGAKYIPEVMSAVKGFATQASGKLGDVLLNFRYPGGICPAPVQEKVQNIFLNGAQNAVCNAADTPLRFVAQQKASAAAAGLASAVSGLGFGKAVQETAGNATSAIKGAVNNGTCSIKEAANHLEVCLPNERPWFYDTRQAVSKTLATYLPWAQSKVSNGLTWAGNSASGIKNTVSGKVDDTILNFNHPGGICKTPVKPPDLLSQPPKIQSFPGEEPLSYQAGQRMKQGAGYAGDTLRGAWNSLPSARSVWDSITNSGVVNTAYNKVFSGASANGTHKAAEKATEGVAGKLLNETMPTPTAV